MPARTWRIVILSLGAAAGVLFMRRRPVRRPDSAGSWRPVDD
jgi:hypothetical protein